MVGRCVRRLCSHGASDVSVATVARVIRRGLPAACLTQARATSSPAMPGRKVHKQTLKTPSYARLTPLAKGRIIGLREKGAGRKEIASKVLKKDGSQSSLKTIDNVLSRFADDPEWDGCEDRTAGGRPRVLTAQQEARIKDILRKDVGRYVVSAARVNRFLKDLCGVPGRTIQRTS